MKKFISGVVVGSLCLLLIRVQILPAASPAMSAAMRSVLFPGLGQRYNGENKKSLIFIIAGGVLILTTAYMFYNSSQKWNSYSDFYNTNPNDSSLDSLYNNYSSSVKTGNIFLGVTVAFWLYNVYDAYSGASKKSSVDYDLDMSPITGDEDVAAATNKTDMKKDSSKAGSSTLIECPNCHTKIPGDSVFCPNCGFKIPKLEKKKQKKNAQKKAKHFCPKCGKEVPAESVFCPYCGAKVK